MRCRTARRKLLDLDLSTTRQPVDARLERHLVACAACAAERRSAAILVRDLRSLRSEPPFELDVRAAVLRALARSHAHGAGRSPVLDRAALAWLAAGVAAVFAPLAWGAWHARALVAGAGQGWSVAAALGRVLLHFGRAWDKALEAGLRTALEWVAATSSALGPEGVGLSMRSLSFWAAFVMIALTAAALLHDARRNPPISDQEPLP